MIEYTKVMHVENLKKLLDMGVLCDRCPANAQDEIAGLTYGCCDVCQDFIEIETKYRQTGECPCNMLGEEEALRRTRLALKGYSK